MVAVFDCGQPITPPQAVQIRGSGGVPRQSESEHGMTLAGEMFAEVTHFLG